MSYIVSIKRPISKSDLLAAIEGDDQFSVVTDGDNDVTLAWLKGDERATFSLSQGEITVTTPSEHAWQKMDDLAGKLDAAVIGEEDDPPVHSNVEAGIFANRQTWIGWPVLVIILAALLIWKW